MNYVVVPGAGSAGLVWETAATALDAVVLPLPDESEVAAMAAALAPAVADVPRPRTLVGTSLGAMVALEIARIVEVDGLALVAAGFGIEVGESVLEWIAANPPDLLDKMASIGLADRDDVALVAARRADFAARGPAVLLRHLTALAAYRPSVPDPPLPAVVVWGERDRSVPLADHAQLALRLGGVLVPVAGAGHAPFLEQPEATVRAIRQLERLAFTNAS
jgi:pimeloyl-ACP methyl ester carboxylesterase